MTRKSILLLTVIFGIALYFNSCSSELTDTNITEKTLPQLGLEDILKLALERRDFSLDLQQSYQRDTLAIPIIQQYRKLDSRFDSITKLYEDFDRRQYDSLIWHPVLFAEETDLDLDNVGEIVLFIGYRLSAPEMIVFDRTNEGYKIIGSEHLWMHNEYPDYEIIRKGESPMIRTSQFYNRGSGAWLKVNHYHKMIDSSLNLVFRTPTSANMSLGFNGLYINGKLLQDSIIGNQIILSYLVNAQIDDRYIADSVTHELTNVYTDELFRATYQWDNMDNTFTTEQADIAEYLLNVNNDTCVFEFIKPKLIEMNTIKSKSYIGVYSNTSCRNEF